MKKMLSILSAVSLTATGASGVIACKRDEHKHDEHKHDEHKHD